MHSRILEKNDIEEITNKSAIRTIWQTNPLIEKSLADTASKKYLSSIISDSKSLGIFENNELVGIIIGNIPEWDSKYFGYDSYFVKNVWSDSTENLRLLLESLNEHLIDWKIKYVYSKIPANSKNAIRAFEEAGYLMADFRITLNKELDFPNKFPIDYGDFQFRLALKEEDQEIAELCRNVSKINRFHSDPLIPTRVADDIYYWWIINGLKSGKDTIVGTYGSKIVAFHMSYPEPEISIDGNPLLSFTDILGVDSEFGKMGLGRKLFENYFALAISQGCKSAVSGVHANNVPSMRLHEGLGYRTIYSEIGLRKWY